jgi:hypothetical protein
MKAGGLLIMEFAFPLVLPKFESVGRSLRSFRFRIYRRFTNRFTLRLDELETDRLYLRLHRESADADERHSIEYEHMYESIEIDERRALYFTNKVRATAKRLYIDTPPLTWRDDDPNWERCTRIAYGQHFLKPAAVEEIRNRIWAHREATWKPLFLWSVFLSGWITLILKIAADFFQK